MTAEPAHGTTARYRRLCRCDKCRAANTRYDQYRRLDILQGRERTVDATGSRRRIEALQRLGWPMQAIADRCGYKTLQAIKRITERDRVTVATAERIRVAFDAMCMMPGPSEPARKMAIRKGFVPALAWDDIDNDAEPVAAATSSDHEAIIDPVIVDRVVNGNRRTRKLSHAESAEAVKRLVARGLSTHQIENEYGFKVERYYRRPEVA